jgi:ferredoxin
MILVTSSNSAKDNNLIIKKEKVSQFLNGLKGYTLCAPVQDGETVIFKTVNDPDKITLDFSNSVKSPKGAVLPQTETMLKIEKSQKSITITEPDINDKQVIFGIRPCDARALLNLDKVFLEGFKDSYYESRRENSVLIGLACNEPHRNCYCTSVGGTPNGTDGLDMLWTDLGSDYYVSVLTKKGKELIGKSKLFSKAGDKDTKKKNSIHKKAAESMSEKVNADALPKKLRGLFEDGVWEEIAMKCIGCGCCTYMCPTCYCFDINDIEFGDKTKRVRTWDSCQFSTYSIHTSGHNPRNNKENRVRNRLLHKFLYHHENYKEHGCVGCGRCINHCPVDMNTRLIIKELADK